jgi:hypothetical protein
MEGAGVDRVMNYSTRILWILWIFFGCVADSFLIILIIRVKKEKSEGVRRMGMAQHEGH